MAMPPRPDFPDPPAKEPARLSPRIVASDPPPVPQVQVPPLAPPDLPPVPAIRSTRPGERNDREPSWLPLLC
jgi:hypothetical protein